jgi:hypothetical protein
MPCTPLKDEGWWSCCFYFSCVMLIPELPTKRRWKNSRQWIVSSFNFRQPYKGLWYIKVPYHLLFHAIYNITNFLCSFSDYYSITTTEEILERWKSFMNWCRYFSLLQMLELSKTVNIIRFILSLVVYHRWIKQTTHSVLSFYIGPNSPIQANFVGMS